MRVFHLTVAKAAAGHPDWNGCSADRNCEVWTNGDEARARELAHRKFWQEATPVKADQSSPWTDPEMVACREIPMPPEMAAPADEAVFGWDERLLAGEPAPTRGEPSGARQDPTKKLDQH